jgi:hypothetical protein
MPLLSKITSRLAINMGDMKDIFARRGRRRIKVVGKSTTP